VCLSGIFIFAVDFSAAVRQPRPPFRPKPEDLLPVTFPFETEMFGDRAEFLTGAIEVGIGNYRFKSQPCLFRDIASVLHLFPDKREEF